MWLFPSICQAHRACQVRYTLVPPSPRPENWVCLAVSPVRVGHLRAWVLLFLEPGTRRQCWPGLPTVLTGIWTGTLISADPPVQKARPQDWSRGREDADHPSSHPPHHAVLPIRIQQSTEECPNAKHRSTAGVGWRERREAGEENEHLQHSTAPSFSFSFHLGKYI